MLEKEFQYYRDNQADLVAKYDGRWVVIVGETVVGDFDNQLAAYDDAVEKYEKGKFLIQQCTPGEESYTQTFHSRVVV